MPTPKVITPPDAALYLKQGFDQMAELLAITLGPSQGHVLNQSQKTGRPEPIDDAATIARRMIALPDRRQDVGAMLLRQLVWRVHKQVGDGSATTAVLAQAILDRATRLVVAGANPVLLQRGIEKGVELALAALARMAQPVQGQEDLAAVAQAVTGHPRLAWILGEMYDLLGPQAYITVENYVAAYLERAYYEGGRWSGQLISPYFITAPATGQAILKECAIALYTAPLKEMEPLKGLLDLAAQQEPPHLLLIAPEISGQAVNLLAGVHQHPKNRLKIAAFALKIGGAKGHQELSDLALLTGATLLGDDMGRPLASVKPQDLGRAARIEAGQKELFAIRGRGNLQAAGVESLLDFPLRSGALPASAGDQGGVGQAIREQIMAWQARLESLEADDEERQELQRRLTRLSGNAGILKIGAPTKAEQQLLRQKAEQGIKALSATMAGGVLPGGGIAYARAAACLDPDNETSSLVAGGLGGVNGGVEDERLGLLAFRQALSAPFFRILQNAYVPAPAVILNDALAAGPDYVYDVIQGKICPAREAGLMDSAKIAARVLETAASGAIMALTIDVTVLKRRPVTNVNYEP